MTNDQRKARKKLLEMVGYFRRCTQEWNGHPWWAREYEAVVATTEMVYATDSFATANFVAIASCINQLVGQEHCKGSGWADFQLRVSYFFYTFGYKSDWNAATSEFTFWKDGALFEIML